jgi:predicted RNA-binding Zn-ribbon protein involved in translation (DUF1610 family)
MVKYACSLCGGELARGRAAIRKSLAAKLSWPLASDRLFYKADKVESKSELVIREGGSYEAFKCGSCGSIMLTRKSWAPEI